MNNENGRSIVEMIAVLAIMGVITIGGLSAFRSAMNKMHANGIASAIAEMSVEAQLTAGCTDSKDLDDFEMPKCVEVLRGASSGLVKITFKTDDGCEDIERAVGGSFARCKWEKKNEHTYLYIPNGARVCPCSDEEKKNDSCPACSENCENYQADSCL